MLNIFKHYSNTFSQFLNEKSRVLAILFAFITNKLYVFESKNMLPKVVIKEFFKFTWARLLTGFVDLAIMFIAVDIAHGPAVIFKIFSNIVVIILNYILSKFIVFKKK